MHDLARGAQLARVNLKLHKPQGRAFLTRANEVLFGGAAGGGKSHLMRSAAVAWCCQIPGLQVYLFRRLYTDLVQNHLEGPSGFREMLAPMARAGLVNVSNHRVAFANGSRIYLAHCRDENALSKYQGVEIHLLLMDELTHFTESMYRYLRGRCRISGLQIPPSLAGLFPRVLCGSNPGGVGHHWVKQTFVDNGPLELFRASRKEGGMLRQFIPSRLEDNPSLLANDPGYIDRLEGLGDQMLVRMLKEGDWDVVAGSMFGDVWRKTRHVCDPFPIPSHWDLWRSGDDGFSAPTSIHWFTQDPDIGTIYVIGEVYRTGMLPQEVAERAKGQDSSIVLMSQDGSTFHNRQGLAGYYDSSAFAETGTGEIARGKRMNELGLRWKPVPKWPGSRVHRVQELHRRLAPNPRDRTGRPGLIFFRTCKAAIRTIPTLQRDDTNIEDVDTDGEDHAFDSVTYGLQWRPSQVLKMAVTGT
jgi:hypothetical protein